MFQKLIIKLSVKPLLIKHYKQVYKEYLNAPISDDSYELGQLADCEYIMGKYFGFKFKEFLAAQEAVRHGKKRPGDSVQSQN